MQAGQLHLLFKNVTEVDFFNQKGCRSFILSASYVSVDGLAHSIEK